ncbi:hypothetical protein NPIL_334171 [Nephila pilipes]|uniref:Uncharacterized protein n=1 Tax=Nephila pilipes TaxID=299642 RepID=A0A8X6MW32_NEPPI|nr:hypothetical protein NPIL_334171 [Nephila pilipes]
MIHSQQKSAHKSKGEEFTVSTKVIRKAAEMRDVFQLDKVPYILNEFVGVRGQNQNKLDVIFLALKGVMDAVDILVQLSKVISKASPPISRADYKIRPSPTLFRPTRCPDEKKRV